MTKPKLLGGFFGKSTNRYLISDAEAKKAAVRCQHVALNVKGLIRQVASFVHFIQKITAAKLAPETLQERTDECSRHLSL